MSVPRPLRFVYGNVLFGEKPGDAWALFELATHSYAHLSVERKHELLGRLTAGLEAAQADVQLIRVTRAWDVDVYADELAAGHTGPHGEAHARYLAEHRAQLSDGAPGQPVVFIAVRLSEPERDVASYVSQALESSPRRWLSALREASAWRDPGVLAASELERLRVAADQAHARLADFLDATPASGAQVQWLVRRAFCRSLGEPEVDGLHEPPALVFERNGQAVLAPLEADVLRWTDSVIERRGRALRIVSELGESWQALLVLGALPERAPFPSERVELMFAPVERLGFPVDLTLNARYLPGELAVRLARRRVQDADQIARAEADGDQGITDQGYARTQDARDLLAYLQSASRPPLLRATISLAVSAADEDELERRVEACRRAWGEVRLHRPLGDQLALFCQHLPGQASRIAGYDDVLTCEQVAAMMPTGAHTVGSESGFYLGHTVSGSRRPVRFDVREGSVTDRPTTVLAVGSLGTGKTILTQKLLHEGFLDGARIVDVDPKGDHRLHLLDDVAPHAETITLAPERSLRGLLDPLRVAPAHLRQDAAVAFLCDLLPPGSSAPWITAVITAVDKIVQRSETPTCFSVLQALALGDETDRQVMKTLAVYAGSGLSQLGFADPDVRLPPVGSKQVTYLAIRDLPAPQPGVPRSEYTQSERIAEQIVRLIALFAMHLMGTERDRLKLFGFDEGWRLLSDPAGRLLLSALGRMGRSELAVPIIGTQLVTDTMSDTESLENLVGATFVFGMRATSEARRALALLGLDPDDERLVSMLLELDRGRCLLRDHRGRVEAVQVDLVAPWLLRELSTTPGDRADAQTLAA